MQCSTTHIAVRFCCLVAYVALHVNWLGVCTVGGMGLSIQGYDAMGRGGNSDSHGGTKYGSK